MPCMRPTGIWNSCCYSARMEENVLHLLPYATTHCGMTMLKTVLVSRITHCRRAKGNKRERSEEYVWTAKANQIQMSVHFITNTLIPPWKVYANIFSIYPRSLEKWKHISAEDGLVTNKPITNSCWSAFRAAKAGEDRTSNVPSVKPRHYPLSHAANELCISIHASVCESGDAITILG